MGDGNLLGPSDISYNNNMYVMIGRLWVNLIIFLLVYTELILVWMCRKLIETLWKLFLEPTSTEKWV